MSDLETLAELAVQERDGIQAARTAEIEDLTRRMIVILQSQIEMMQMLSRLPHFTRKLKVCTPSPIKPKVHRLVNCPVCENRMKCKNCIQAWMRHAKQFPDDRYKVVEFAQKRIAGQRVSKVKLLIADQM